MSDNRPNEVTVAEGFLSALAAHGVDFLFGNGGTDFPPIIEGIARLEKAGRAVPRAIAVPHENLAMAMAYGHTMVSGRAQAVVVHVNVGTANAINGLFNAARGNIPLLLAAGRTPITQDGVFGGRTRFIQWAQELYDQGAMVREIVKWDYELRAPGQVGAAVDRALAIARTPPQGPVYLSLPREVLAAPLPGAGGAADPAAHRFPASPRAHPEDIAETAEILARARNPLMIVSALGRDAAAVAALADFAERFAMPVVSHFPTHLCLPSDHPLHAGYDPAPWLAEADAVLVLESDVPWIPKVAKPLPDCRVVHVGLDPLFANYPMRDFPCHLAMTAASREVLEALSPVLSEKLPAGGQAIAERRGEIAARLRAARAGTAGSSGIGQAWISRCLDGARPHDAIVISELGLDLSAMSFTRPGTYFGPSPAGGLGWGLGAALGAKLAAPERPVIAVVGDGSYMFGNPTPAHLTARTLGLAVLFIVVNNGKWGAVERATRAMYPEGRAATAPQPMPLTTFGESPAYHQVAQASGAYGERVEKPDDLPAALERAMTVVREEGRQALLDVIC